MTLQSNKYYDYLKAISENTLDLEKINYTITKGLSKEEKILIRKICIKILNELK